MTATLIWVTVQKRLGASELKDRNKRCCGSV